MNEANWERILRAVADVGLLALAFLGLEGALAVVLGTVGGILLVTGAIGWCPLYAIFKFRTRQDSPTTA